jgi:hypothetical protein
MREPLFLVLAQWVLLFALAVLMIVMFRQLGWLLSKTGKPAELGPPVGSRAARISYLAVPGGEPGQLTPGDGQPALIAFVDPTCPACEQLVTSLDAAQAAGDLAGFAVLLLVSDPPRYLQISPAFTGSSLQIGRPASRAEVTSYRATGTPLLVAVDNMGIVRAAGPASRPAEVQASVQACLAGREREGIR